MSAELNSNDENQPSWCLIDSQSMTVITTKDTKEAILKEQDRNIYGQTFTEIGYGYEDEENDSEFVAVAEPGAATSPKP